MSTILNLYFLSGNFNGVNPGNSKVLDPFVWCMVYLWFLYLSRDMKELSQRLETCSVSLKGQIYDNSFRHIYNIHVYNLFLNIYFFMFLDETPFRRKSKFWDGYFNTGYLIPFLFLKCLFSETRNPFFHEIMWISLLECWPSGLTRVSKAV